MQYGELGPDTIFRFVNDEGAGFNFMKIDNERFMDLTDREVISFEDDVFEGISERIEVEEWDPSIEDVIEEELGFEEGPDEIELTPNAYFPDYELIASYGSKTLHQFDIHCWEDDEDEEMHTAILWFKGACVMNTKRWIVESIIGLGMEPLEALFGEIDG